MRHRRNFAGDIRELERRETVSGLGDFRLRPVRPEDEPALVTMFKHLSAEDVRLRFFASLREMPHSQLARLTQIDYDREMALLLEKADSSDAPEILEVVRLAADPDNVRAEFAVTVRSDVKGRGVGTLLMNRLIEYARSRGIQEIFGLVLKENAAMLALCKDLDFMLTQVDEQPSILLVTRRVAR